MTTDHLKTGRELTSKVSCISSTCREWMMFCITYSWLLEVLYKTATVTIWNAVLSVLTLWLVTYMMNNMILHRHCSSAILMTMELHSCCVLLLVSAVIAYYVDDIDWIISEILPKISNLCGCCTVLATQNNFNALESVTVSYIALMWC
jgi:hypothetical protein